MTAKRRSILLAVLTLVLCLALIAGGTYALFSDSVTMKNHLQAGTLDITLKRTKLTGLSLDNKTGFLVPVNDNSVVDFSEPTDRNVFDITNETLIVPGSLYVAEMTISNETNEFRKSDVAFGYWVEIVLDTKNEDGTSISDEELAKLVLDDQLEITLESASGHKDKAYLSKGRIVIAEDSPVVLVKKATDSNRKWSDTFTVTVEFRDLDYSVNNAAKGQGVKFDIIVHAVQITTDPTVTP